MRLQDNNNLRTVEDITFEQVKQLPLREMFANESYQRLLDELDIVKLSL